MAVTLNGSVTLYGLVNRANYTCTAVAINTYGASDVSEAWGAVLMPKWV